MYKNMRIGIIIWLFFGMVGYIINLIRHKKIIESLTIGFCIQTFVFIFGGFITLLVMWLMFTIEVGESPLPKRWKPKWWDHQL